VRRAGVFGAQSSNLKDPELWNRLVPFDAQIEANGGLESYQIASKLGQSMDRGGDSSKVLIDKLEPGL
jgi:hypothetical protein